MGSERPPGKGAAARLAAQERGRSPGAPTKGHPERHGPPFPQAGSHCAHVLQLPGASRRELSVGVLGHLPPSTVAPPGSLGTARGRPHWLSTGIGVGVGFTALQAARGAVGPLGRALGWSPGVAWWGGLLAGLYPGVTVGENWGPWVSATTLGVRSGVPAVLCSPPHPPRPGARDPEADRQAQAGGEAAEGPARRRAAAGGGGRGPALRAPGGGAAGAAPAGEGGAVPAGAGARPAAVRVPAPAPRRGGVGQRLRRAGCAWTPE